ncbi:hypothetical protein, partial [Pseudomonas lactis]|uniref:hypothetical protein n=1 Tax=Pseudomonas lactis TaxID=1615674 RepID=UPI001E55D242
MNGHRASCILRYLPGDFSARSGRAVIILTAFCSEKSIYTLSVVSPQANHDAKRAALDLDLLLILSAPLNHAG